MLGIIPNDKQVSYHLTESRQYHLENLKLIDNNTKSPEHNVRDATPDGSLIPRKVDAVTVQKPPKSHIHQPNQTEPEDKQLSDLINKESKLFIKNAMHNNVDIYVTYDNDKFTFTDVNNSYIGSFNVDHVIKYFGGVCDPSNFMSHIVSMDYKNACVLIEKFIGKAKYNVATKSTDITILNHAESPFMGNIKMLMHINKLLYVFEKHRLSHELTFVNGKVQKKIERSVKQFIYIMLNYTLSIIALASDSIKDDTSKDTLKYGLVQYSMNIIRRIIEYTQSQMIVVMKKYREMERLRLINMKLQDIQIKKQEKIISLLHKKPGNKQDGGDGKRKDADGGDDGGDGGYEEDEGDSSSNLSSLDEHRLKKILSDNDHNGIIVL